MSIHKFHAFQHSRLTSFTWLLTLTLYGCSEETTEDTDTQQHHCPTSKPFENDPLIDCIESFEPADDVSFGHDKLPDIILGPPQGGGLMQGSTDVVSLGCGGSITVYFAEPGIVNGHGIDFLIFENPFMAGSVTFIEPAQVSVSEDGDVWHTFPCQPAVQEEMSLAGCAGIHPVLANGTNAIDPRDPEKAGGDGFDLDELGLHKAHFVRIDDRTEEYYGHRQWCAGAAGGFDLDAMAVVHD